MSWSSCSSNVSNSGILIIKFSGPTTFRIYSIDISLQPLYHRLQICCLTIQIHFELLAFITSCCSVYIVCVSRCRHVSLFDIWRRARYALSHSFVPDLLLISTSGSKKGLLLDTLCLRRDACDPFGIYITAFDGCSCWSLLSAVSPNSIKVCHISDCMKLPSSI